MSYAEYYSSTDSHLMRIRGAVLEPRCVADSSNNPQPQHRSARFLDSTGERPVLVDAEEVAASQDLTCVVPHLDSPVADGARVERLGAVRSPARSADTQRFAPLLDSLVEPDVVNGIAGASTLHVGQEPHLGTLGETVAATDELSVLDPCSYAVLGDAEG